MNSVRVLPRMVAASSMSRRVSVSIRRLMMPFVPDAEERSTTATFAVPRLSDDEEWSFGMTTNMICRIHNVNTRAQLRAASRRARTAAARRFEATARPWPSRERARRALLLHMLVEEGGDLGEDLLRLGRRVVAQVVGMRLELIDLEDRIDPGMAELAVDAHRVGEQEVARAARQDRGREARHVAVDGREQRVLEVATGGVDLGAGVAEAVARHEHVVDHLVGVEGVAGLGHVRTSASPRRCRLASAHRPASP